MENPAQLVATEGKNGLTQYKGMVITAAVSFAAGWGFRVLCEKLAAMALEKKRAEELATKLAA